MQRRPKVVHLTSVHKPFDVRIFHKECKSLVHSGKHVILIAPHEKNETVDSIEIRAVPSHHGRLARMTKTAWSVYREALCQKGDVYHFHDPELIPVGLLLSAQGQRVVYDVHEDVPADILHKPYIPKCLRRLIMSCVRAVENHAARHFYGLVTATSGIAKRFRKINANTCVVHNFPATEEVVPATVLWKTRPLAIAYIGTISLRRGINKMLTAMAILSSEVPAQMMLAGPFSPDGLEQQLQPLLMRSRVRYLGVLDRKGVADLLSRVRVGLVLLQPEPNFVNAMPIKLFEYMAAGIPVIASDFPLWRKIVGQANCGLLVDPEDPVAIARSLEWLLMHEAEAEEMGRRGRQAACDFYSWNKEERTLLQFYCRLLDSSRDEKGNDNLLQLNADPFIAR